MSGERAFQADYEEVTGLSIFVTKTSTDHISCARNNLSPWVAFMRWQFCGEQDRWKKEFMPAGNCSSPWLAGQTKLF